MGFELIVNGKPFSPERALREKLPFDIELVCPNCESRHVEARPARTIERIGMETHHTIPRMQDRRCQRCKHEWTAVLPPESVYHP